MVWHGIMGMLACCSPVVYTLYLILNIIPQQTINTIIKLQFIRLHIQIQLSLNGKMLNKVDFFSFHSIIYVIFLWIRRSCSIIYDCETDSLKIRFSFVLILWLFVIFINRFSSEYSTEE